MKFVIITLLALAPVAAQAQSVNCYVSNSGRNVNCTGSDGSYSNTYNSGRNSTTTYSDGSYSNTYRNNNSSTTYDSQTRKTTTCYRTGNNVTCY